MTKVVIDTNVFISGLINPEGNPAKIISMLLNGHITMLYDIRIMDEYRRVLRREKFGFSDKLIEPLLEYIKSEGEYIIPNSEFKEFKDEDDKKFYETAISGGAEYLITGNKAHFPRERMVVSPTEFLKEDVD